MKNILDSVMDENVMSLNDAIELLAEIDTMVNTAYDDAVMQLEERENSLHPGDAG